MKSNYKQLGQYIEPVSQLNEGMEVQELLGISNQKFFQNSHTNTIGIDLQTYRIVRTNQFAYNRATTRNGDKISISLRQGNDCIVSPSYRIFRSKDENILNSEYLMMWFRRPEFDRYARFKSHGSAHEFFEYDQMCQVELPIPSITKQREIVKEYNTIQNRITLNEQLIQKLEETAQAVYKRWFVEFEFPDENGQPYKSSGGEMVWCEELGKEIPRDWKVLALSKIASYINRGITPSYVERDGVIVINQKCVRDNSIDFSFSRRHNDKVKKIDADRYLQHYDILVNSTGEGTLGRVGLVKESHLQLIVDTHVTIVRTSEIMLPLCLWFNLSSRTGEIEKLAEGSTGQTELGRSNLGELQVLIPTNNSQKKFEKTAKAIITHSSKIENEIPVLVSLKDLLLSKLASV
jgi:type I restriction enzyme S subunit